VVDRHRVRYAKRGRLRFASHRDLARMLERALRRSGVPLAFSAGFSPHPRISYLGAAPTGTASEAEYLELGLAVVTEPAEVAARLGGALPAGIDVVEVVRAAPGQPGLAERVEASQWQVLLVGVPVATAQQALARFLEQDRVPVDRRTKQGVREVDARAAIVSARVSGDEHAILDLVARHTTPAVRPDDVLAGLRSVASLTWPSPPVATRLAQGPLTADHQVGDPLAPDRLAAAAYRGVTETSAATRPE
jgi:radical SAM-linked protein